MLTGEIGGRMDVEWYDHGWIYWRLCVVFDNLELELPDVVLLEEYWEAR